MTYDELLENIAIKCSTMTLARKVHSMGIGFRDVKRFTDAERQYIKDNTPGLTAKEIGEHLGRSAETIANYRFFHGLKVRGGKDV